MREDRAPLHNGIHAKLIELIAARQQITVESLVDAIGDLRLPDAEDILSTNRTSITDNVARAQLHLYVHYGLLRNDHASQRDLAAPDTFHPVDVPTPSTWDMFTHQKTREDGTTFCRPFGDTRYVSMNGYPADEQLEVTLTADPEGELLGWFDLPSITGPVPRPYPVMIEHRQLFRIQFPYGVSDEVEVGRGYAVSLSYSPK